MPLAVHFTNHPCVQHHLWTPNTDAPGPWKPDPLYVCGRNPHLSICRAWSRRHRDNADRRTVNPAEVDCKWCLAAIAKNTQEAWQVRARLSADHDPETVRESNVRFWSNWAPDHELTIRAWLTCCKDRGAPWPFDEPERIDSERWYRAARMMKAVGSAMVMFVGPESRTPASVASDLGERIAGLDPADRALIAPALEDARRADKLIAEVQGLLASIEARVNDTATRIRSGEIKVASTPRASGVRSARRGSEARPVHRSRSTRSA